MKSSIKIKGAIKVDKPKMAKIAGGIPPCGTSSGGVILICTSEFRAAAVEDGEAMAAGDVRYIKIYQAS